MIQMTDLIFLKLGGSLITYKNIPRTARSEVIARLAGEIHAIKESDGDVGLILGHGSGSFGHVSAKKYGTRQGVNTTVEWGGFAEVWFQAATLNRILIEALISVGLPAITFPA